MFFLRDVLDDEMLARIVHLYNTADHPKGISWEKVSLMTVIKANRPATSDLQSS